MSCDLLLLNHVICHRVKQTRCVDNHFLGKSVSFVMLLYLQQRIAKKLEAKGKGGAITDQVHSLSDTISREKIAAFKAKRLAKKRATIKPGDDLAGGPVRETSVVVSSLFWKYITSLKPGPPALAAHRVC